MPRMSADSRAASALQAVHSTQGTSPRASIELYNSNLTQHQPPPSHFPRPVHHLSVSFAPSVTAKVHSAEEGQAPRVGFTDPQNAPSSGAAHSPSQGSSTWNDGSNEDGGLESHRSFFLQSFVPFVLAGIGMVAAGVLLDRASGWHFLSNVPEALVLVPALLGLKGNLEMTLASRLSTMANMGQMDSPGQQITALYSNVALIQAQAIVVALVASLLAVGANLVEGNPFDFPRSFVVVLSATLTASMASFALASMMVLLAVASRHCGLNPDNIATPIAAATGDVTSLAFLVIFGTWLYDVRETHLGAMVCCLAALLASALFWMWLSWRVWMTRQVLKYGWFAVLAAMFISSGGGYVLRRAIAHFPGIGLFQPVINGVGGNLVAVQSSKISTSLHRFGKAGLLPANTLLTYANPFRTFACKERESHNALILLAMSVPGHLLFIGMLIFAGEMRSSSLNIPFLAIYLCAAVLQVALLLYFCQLLCRILWRLCFDPDNNAIPLLTSLGDLVGTSLLASAFFLHFELFPEYRTELEEVPSNSTEWAAQLLVAQMNSSSTLGPDN